MSTRKNQLDNFFSKRLHELRTSAGLTQDKLAEKLGISSKVTISRWEKGVRKPELDNCQALATYFNVNLAWLTDGIGPKSPAGQPITVKTVIATYKEDEKDTTSSLASDGKGNWTTQPTSRPPPYLSEDDRIRIERRLINAFWSADESTRSHAMILLEDSAKPEGSTKNGTEG